MDRTPSLEHLRDALAVAVDDSPPAREALRFAADLAVGLGRPLHVLHLWNFTGPAPEQGQDESPSVQAWQEEAERRLDALLREEVADVVGLDVRPVVLHGNTTSTLLGVSELVAQLILGSRGRGGFEGLLLGSTSAHLVGHAGCPVTVVRHRSTS